METKDLCEETDSKASSYVSMQCHSSTEHHLGVDTGSGVCDKDSENVLLVSQSEVQQMDQGIGNSESSSSVDKTTVHSNDGSHHVIWTVRIAMAIPKGEDEEPVIAVEKAKKKPKRVLSSGVVEAPKAQGYYHIEYNLLPDDPEPTRVDLVMFGLAAKVYMENETKVLRPWQEREQVWLGWSQSVQVRVTRDLLIKLASHKITFRVWDTKDRVSAKARYDRPKAFRLPHSRSGEESDPLGGIKYLVSELRAVFEKENPRTRSSKRRGDPTSTEFKRSSDLNCATVEPRASTTEVSASEKVSSSAALNAGSALSEAEQQCARKRSACGVEQDLQPGDTKSTKAEGPQEQEMEAAPSKPTAALDQSSKAPRDKTSKTTLPPAKSSSAKDKNLVVPRKKAFHRPTPESAAHMENIRKNGMASVELSLIYLLAGDRSLTDCLVTCSPGVYEGLCNITLDRPLISTEQKAELNPLVITILSANSLPSSPVPFYVLEEKCQPVYCQYRFHNLSAHRTKGQEHGTNVYFKDVNVILAGLLGPGELLEFLRGPPLEIEVHDRDRKVAGPPASPALFGTEPDDDRLSSVTLVGGKRAALNPFEDGGEPYNPCGIARLDLSELLRGQRSLKANLPIRCSPPPQLLGSERSQWEREMIGGPGATCQPVPTGHYLDANSQLKVQVEIACPLDAEDVGEGASDCPFGRAVYVFRYENAAAAAKLRSEILRINATAFQLGSHSDESVERALSGHRMTAKQRASGDLDAITGFHLLDKQIHLFVLEGPRQKAIKRLWETVPIKLTGGEDQHVTVLYNSALGFSERLYDTLDVGLTPVHLHEPLETIMRQPLVYVRDMVPHTCFKALSRLSLLCQLRKLRGAVQNNLFPSAEMVLSMSKEFGVVPGKREHRLMAKAQEEAGMSPPRPVEGARRPLSTYNGQYMQWKQLQLLKHDKDFVQANIEFVQRASSQAPKPKAVVIVAEQAKDGAAHNYSIQTMNTTEQARELLRKQMAEEPARRFTYSQQYHTATVAPRDAEAERRASETRSRSAWRTRDGFTYPGFKSGIESNQHPKRPDDARVEELRKAWRENVLHGNTLSPTLTRDTWPSVRHHQDFQLSIKPHPVFSPAPPVTIHLAGETLQREQLEAARSQYSRWLRRVFPSGSAPARARVPEFRCHMGGADPGKLQGLLKDTPMKYSLRKPGMVLKPVPVLAVVQRPQGQGPEEVGRESSIPFAPGPFQNHSLSWDHNTIPRHDSQYHQFHFTEFWRQRSLRHKRAAPPLTEEEQSAHAFQRPSAPPGARTQPRAVQPPPARNIVETRTYNDVTLHVQ